MNRKKLLIYSGPIVFAGVCGLNFSLWSRWLHINSTVIKLQVALIAAWLFGVLTMFFIDAWLQEFEEE